MACEKCDAEINELNGEILSRDDRIKELEKALDDVQDEINSAKDDLATHRRSSGG